MNFKSERDFGGTIKMCEDVNILILSCGTRNKIVQYFCKELQGKGIVVAADCSSLAPALYEAPKHYIVPRMDDENYLTVLLSICKDNNIKAVFSLIDPELSFLAEHKQSFLDVGSLVIVSELELVEMCFDKYKMYKFLSENGIRSAISYIAKEDFYADLDAGIIAYPVIVKPVRGSASNNINIVSSKEEIDLLFKLHELLMIQEYMDGPEYGVDVYVDMITKAPVAIFSKEKIKMRAGETDKSRSIKDEKLFELIKSLIKIAPFIGMIDIDLFKVKDEYYVSEINPRFGGGYPHAYESGVNIPQLLIRNLNGIKNEECIGEYDENTFMMKYNEVLFKRF